MAFESRFPVFAVTADIVVLTLRQGRLCVLLIRRSSSVFTGRWALPGGFVHVDESLEEAAYRELREEAGIGSDLSSCGPTGPPAVTRAPNGSCRSRGSPWGWTCPTPPLTPTLTGPNGCP